MPACHLTLWGSTTNAGAQNVGEGLVQPAAKLAPVCHFDIKLDEPQSFDPQLRPAFTLTGTHMSPAPTGPCVACHVGRQLTTLNSTELLRLPTRRRSQTGTTVGGKLYRNPRYVRVPFPITAFGLRVVPPDYHLWLREVFDQQHHRIPASSTGARHCGLAPRVVATSAETIALKNIAPTDCAEIPGCHLNTNFWAGGWQGPPTPRPTLSAGPFYFAVANCCPIATRRFQAFNHPQRLTTPRPGILP